MINFALKQTRKWMPVMKTNPTYGKLFVQALDNFELNRLEEKHLSPSFVLSPKTKKAGY